MSFRRFAASGAPLIAQRIQVVFRAPSRCQQPYLSLVSVRRQSYLPPQASIDDQNHARRRMRRRSPALTQLKVSGRNHPDKYYSTDGSQEKCSRGDVVLLFDPHVLPSSVTLLKQEDHELSLMEIDLKRALKEYLQEISSLPVHIDEGKQRSGPNIRPSQSVMEDLQRAYMELGYWEESLQLEQSKCALYLEPDTDEYADSIHAQGKFYLRQEDFRNSKRLYQEALQYFESSGNAIQQGHVLISIAGWYYFRNQLDEALESLAQSETLIGSNPALLVKCLDNQGLIYRLWGEFNTALDKYQQALQVVVDKDTEWALRLHVGDMLVALDEPQEALAVYQTLLEDTTTAPSSSSSKTPSLQQRQEGHRLGMQGVLLHNIATIHVDQGDYDLALDEFRQALHLKQSAPGGECNPEVAKTLNSLGALHAGVFDEKLRALEYFHQALLIARIHTDGDPKTDPDVLAAVQNIAMMEQELQQGEKKAS